MRAVSWAVMLVAALFLVPFAVSNRAIVSLGLEWSRKYSAILIDSGNGFDPYAIRHASGAETSK